LICTTGRRIPASASTNHGPEKGDLIQAAKKLLADEAARKAEKVSIWHI